MHPNQQKLQQLSPKSTSAKYQQYSDIKRYIDNIPKRQANQTPSSNLAASADTSHKINPSVNNHQQKNYSMNIHHSQLASSSTQPSTRQNNPYLSPVSLGRLKQLQLGKRFLRDMKQQQQTGNNNNTMIKPVSPGGATANNAQILAGLKSYNNNNHNNMTTGGSTTLIPKYKSQFDASHGVNSYQLPNNQKQSQKYNYGGNQVRSSSTKHKKPVNGNNPLLNNYQYRQHQQQALSSREPVANNSFSQQQQQYHNHTYSFPEDMLRTHTKGVFTNEIRISQNNKQYTLTLQPWSIYFTPSDPGQKIEYNLPPDRKIPPNEKIEKELKDFKREIDQKFVKTPLKAYKFPRIVGDNQDSNSELDSEFSEFGDEMVANIQQQIEEQQEEARNYYHTNNIPGRNAPQPNIIHIQNQQHAARQILNTSSAQRGGGGIIKQSPLRGGVGGGFNQQMNQTQQYEQGKMMAYSGQRGEPIVYPKGGSSKVKNKPNYSKPLQQFSGERGYMREVLGPQIYEHYQSKGVVALVSPTTRVRKVGNIQQNTPKHESGKPLTILKDISFERKPPSKRKKLKLNGLNSTDFQIISRNSSNLSPPYMNSLHSTQNAWEQSQPVSSPKPKAMHQGGGGGTGAPLTPPPVPYAFSPDQEPSSPQQRQSPRGNVHCSYMISGQIVSSQQRNQSKYLNKDNKNAKSQSNKQGGMRNEQNQIFTPTNQIVTGKGKKSQPLQPLELLSSEQISPPQSIPLQSTNTNSNQSKPPSGGTGSITYHQSETVVSPNNNTNSTNINSSSYRSLRQNKQPLQLLHNNNNTTRSSSKPKHPLIDVNSPTNRQQQQLFASSASSTAKNTIHSSYNHPKVLPPDTLSSVYLKSTPQYHHYQASGKSNYTTSAQSRVLTNNSSQQPSSRGTYHGNWSILGTGNNHNLSTSKNNNTNERISDIYMGNQILQPSNSSKFKRNYKGPSGGLSHQRAKTSHIQSSQSQLGAGTASHQTSHNDSHQLLNNQHNSSQKLSARKLQQQQQQLNHSGSSGRKAKNSSGGGKKKQSIKNLSNGGYTHQTPNSFDLNISFDQSGINSGIQTTTAAQGRTMHSTTLSREINMINQQIQNADQTMKLLVDDDLRMGFFKPGTTKGQERPNLRNVTIRSPTNAAGNNSMRNQFIASANLMSGGGYRRTQQPQSYQKIIPVSPTNSRVGKGGGVLSSNNTQRPVNQYLQQQYKRRFKAQIINKPTSSNSISFHLPQSNYYESSGFSGTQALSTSAEPMYMSRGGGGGGGVGVVGIDTTDDHKISQEAKYSKTAKKLPQ